MTETPNMGLPHIAGDQAQKHVTHNEALDLIDALAMQQVKSRSVFEPPVSPEPEDGDVYIVPAPDISPGASGDFEGEDNSVAVLQDGAWRFLTPKVGWFFSVDDENGALVRWNGEEWVDFDLQFQNIAEATILGRADGAGAGAATALTAAQVRAILDIEVGTWTPTLTAATPGDLAVNYSSRVGSYQKIGDRVSLDVDLIFSLTFTTATSTLMVTGLPYTVSSQNDNYIGGVSIRGNGNVGPTFPTGATGLIVRVRDGNDIVISGNGSGIASGQNNLLITSFTSGNNYIIHFHAEYIAA